MKGFEQPKFKHDGCYSLCVWLRTVYIMLRNWECQLPVRSCAIAALVLLVKPLPCITKQHVVQDALYTKNTKSSSK